MSKLKEKSNTKKVALRDCTNKNNTKIVKEKVTEKKLKMKSKVSDVIEVSEAAIGLLTKKTNAEKYKTTQNKNSKKGGLNKNANIKTTQSEFGVRPNMRHNLRKLSLRKSCTPQSELHELSRFDPRGNSTALDLEESKGAEFVGKEKSKQSIKGTEDQRELRSKSTRTAPKANEDVSSQGGNKSYERHRNLAHKTGIIEELLSADNIEDNLPNNPTSEKQKSAEKQNCSPIKAHKFFTSKDVNVVQQKVEAHKFVEPAPKSKNNTKTRAKSKVTKRRSANRSKAKASVFEFLSQSQNSDSDSGKKKDPAADIIQKLIKEGKVSLATIRIGTGRPIIKRIKRQYKKSAELAVKRRQKTIQQLKNKKNVQIVEEEEDNHAFDDAELLRSPSPVNSVQDHTEQPPEEIKSNQNVTEASSDHLEFDKLKGSKKMIHKRNLLEMARKIVSTPVNERRAPAHLNNLSTYLSPVVPPSPVVSKPSASASPWRVTEEAHLPTTFYFDRNSSNLPSFSSEHIPSTPRKVFLPKLPTSRIESPELTALESRTTKQATLLEQTQLNSTSLSLSSNDSNAENMPPPAPPPVSGKTFRSEQSAARDSNADIFNMRQNPNPRRTLRNRSPLKAINIQEVVILPPWKEINTVKNTDHANSAESIPIEGKTNDSNGVDLFGFEDFLQTDNDLSEPEATSDRQVPMNATPRREELHAKLAKLRTWRPDDNELPCCSKNAKMPRVFDEHAHKPRLRNIKDMFCSTMVQQPAVSAAKQEQLATPRRIVDSDDSDSEEAGQQQKESEGDLFNDTDPHLTFSEKAEQRTYGRPAKRKRKQRHNFILCMDSDSEGEEQAQQVDHELDVQVPTKNKRHKNDEKDQVVLNTFVKEFNEMCQDVQNYELIVE